MDDALLLYSLWSVVLVFALLLIFLGIEKIVKIIVGNYVLGMICFSASMGIDALVLSLQSMGDQRFAWFSAAGWATFFSNGHATIILLLYILLFVWVYKKSTLWFALPVDITIQRSLYIILVPLALVGFILTLYILCRWTGIISPAVLTQRSAQWWFFAVFSRVAWFAPLWIVLHGLCTLLVSMKIRSRVDVDLPDFDDM